MNKEGKAGRGRKQVISGEWQVASRGMRPEAEERAGGSPLDPSVALGSGVRTPVESTGLRKPETRPSTSLGTGTCCARETGKKRALLEAPLQEEGQRIGAERHVGFQAAKV